MSIEFVTILSSWSVEEAHLARIRLIAEGINAHLADEMTVGMDWSLANAMQGVKLRVPKADEERARLILNEEPISDSPDSQTASDTGFSDLENQSSTLNEDEELAPGTLTAFRSFKEPVIWLMLAPTAIGFLALISGGLFEFIHWLKWV